MNERECRLCHRSYTRKLNHIKQYNKKHAYDEFVRKHLSSDPSMCYICKAIFNGDSSNHVALRHRV